MKHGIVSLIVGILFGLGLTVSGMTQPAKVIGFLDILGDWDPTLMFVMIGAIAIHFFAYRWQKHRNSPLLGEHFHLPTSNDSDARLLIGAVIFGVGWGLGGYCPGPGISSIISLQSEVLIFVATMIAGMLLKSVVFPQAK